MALWFFYSNILCATQAVQIKKHPTREVFFGACIFYCLSFILFKRRSTCVLKTVSPTTHHHRHASATHAVDLIAERKHSVALQCHVLYIFNVVVVHCAVNAG